MPARPQKEPPIEVMAGMEPGVEERNSAVAKLFHTEQKMDEVLHRMATFPKPNIERRRRLTKQKLERLKTRLAYWAEQARENNWAPYQETREPRAACEGAVMYDRETCSLEQYY